MIEAIQQSIVSCDEYTTTFLPSDKEVPVDRIIVYLELENKPMEEGQLMEIMLVPNAKEMLGGFEILQYFVTLPFDTSNISKDQEEALNKFIHEENFSLAIGSFGYNTDDKYVYFKYREILSLETDNITNNRINISISLIHYHIKDSFDIINKLISSSL